MAENTASVAVQEPADEELYGAAAAPDLLKEALVFRQVPEQRLDRAIEGFR